MINFIKMTVMAFILASASSLWAQQKIYTWTDDQGNVHITNQAPPEGMTVEDVTTYRERSEAELRAVERRIDERRQEREQERDQARLERLRMRADQAREDARKAALRAEEAKQKALKTYEIYGTTKDNRNQFRKRIQRAFDEAENARREALQASKEAEKLTSEMSTADESSEIAPEAAAKPDQTLE